MMFQNESKMGSSLSMTHDLTKLCYDLRIPVLLSGFSASPYFKVESDKLRALLSCFSTPAKYWERLPSTNKKLALFHLKRVPLGLVKGQLVKYKVAGGGIGYVDAPAIHVASFIWDFNSTYRKKLNLKNDLLRKVFASRSDHSYAALNRKWLPIPFQPRDFYMMYSWKRLDDKRLVIWCWDCNTADYASMCHSNAIKSNKVVRGGNCSIMLFEEVDKEGRKITKFSLISILDMGGR